MIEINSTATLILILQFSLIKKKQNMVHISLAGKCPLPSIYSTMAIMISFPSLPAPLSSLNHFIFSMKL